jgi:hypothetical protein
MRRLDTLGIDLNRSDLLPALKGEGSCEGGSQVPLIYSELYLSFEEHSG